MTTDAPFTSDAVNESTPAIGPSVQIVLAMPLMSLVAVAALSVPPLLFVTANDTRAPANALPVWSVTRTAIGFANAVPTTAVCPSTPSRTVSAVATGCTMTMFSKSLSPHAPSNTSDAIATAACPVRNDTPISPPLHCWLNGSLENDIHERTDQVVRVWAKRKCEGRATDSDTRGVFAFGVTL